MNPGGKKVVGFVLLTAMLVLQASAVMTPIKDIQLNLESNIQWYDVSASSIDLNSGIVEGMGIVNTYATTPNYDYEIKMGNFDLQNTSLTSDNSAGGVAAADFTGGNLTITGQLWNKDLNTMLFDGILLTAKVTANYSLSEQLINNVAGVMEMEVTGGEFATGANTGLIIADFSNRLNFDLADPAVGDFSTGDYTSLVPTVQITAPVPEPITVLLLGAGSLILRKKK